tara:strand:+ start:300 stop:587 length:288 start_codon:yes stop_codon:yes gene_type:complete
MTISPMCEICGYELNGKPSDYAPICSPTTEIPQCNECVICLLYCSCKRSKEVIQKEIDKVQDNIDETKNDAQMALDLITELETELEGLETELEND